MSVNAHVSPSTLSNAYDKARKQLGAFIGLLIAWELLWIGALSVLLAREVVGIRMADISFDATTAFLLMAAFSLGSLLAKLARHRANVGALAWYVTYAGLLYTSLLVVLFNRQPVQAEYLTALVCLFAAGTWRWFMPLSR